MAGQVRREVFERLEVLRGQYPRLNQTDLVEAALAYYLEHAGLGLDAKSQAVGSITSIAHPTKEKTFTQGRVSFASNSPPSVVRGTADVIRLIPYELIVQSAGVGFMVFLKGNATFINRAASYMLG